MNVVLKMCPSVSWLTLVLAERRIYVSIYIMAGHAIVVVKGDPTMHARGC